MHHRSAFFLGLVAYVSGDDLVATMPDGAGRRPLVTGGKWQCGLSSRPHDE